MGDILQSFKSFLNFFTGGGNNINQMSYYKLYTSMQKWLDSKSFPSIHELPDAIYFPEDFWKKVIQLHKDTFYDNHERAISVFWADGDLIVTSIVRGQESSVTPRGNVLVKYVPSTYKGYLKKEVYVDDSLYSRKDVYYKNVPKQIDVK